MLVHFPRIVTDGLVLCLDAGNRLSYPGGGSILSDLSGNAANASLVNNAIVNSSNKGIIDFTQNFTQTSAGNHISTTPGQVYYQYNTELTACCWFKRNGTIAGGSGGGQSTANVDNWATDPAGNVWLFHGNNNNTISFFVNAVNSVSYYSRGITTSTLNDNTWYFICGSCNSTNLKLYINGILYGTATGITSGNIVNNSNSVVQYGKDPRYATNRFFNGYIGQNLLYNRELTANEILQNFNATKGRYGL